MKPQQPLVRDEVERRRVLKDLLRRAEGAHDHLRNCVTNPQKMRYAERVEVYRELALSYCGVEIEPETE